MIKNAVAFRLPNGFDMTAEKLTEALAKSPFQQCGSSEAETCGWVPSRQNAELAHSVQGKILLTLCHEKKILPGSYVKRCVNEKAALIEENEGRKVGRKERKEIEENVVQELMPRAFTSMGFTSGWIDPAARLLVVDTGSVAKAESFIEHLRKTVPDLPKIALINPATSPIGAMSGWLSTFEPPEKFTIDQDCELATSEKAVVRYVKHTLEGEDVRNHLSEGKTPTKLGMTFDDRISFVLTDGLEIKRISLLDIVKEQESQAEGADEIFDAEFFIGSTEFTNMFEALIAAMGGEVQKEEQQD